MGVLHLAGRLRNRLHLRGSGSKFDDAHHRASNLWPRRCWFGQRDDNYPVILRVSEKASDAVSNRPGHVQHRFCYWTTRGRFDNR